MRVPTYLDGHTGVMLLSWCSHFDPYLPKPHSYCGMIEEPLRVLQGLLAAANLASEAPGRVQSCQLLLLIQLCAMQAGVALASASDLTFNWTGFISAMVSNLTFGFRAVWSKK